MKDQCCEVIYQLAVGEGYYRLGLKTDFTSFIPGQFAMLEVPRCDGVLLRRPFSLARQFAENTEILYKVVGKGTSALSHVGVGEKLKLLGPLGKGFTFPNQEGDLVAVAGGYGVAPFLEMAAQLKARDKKLILYYGARTQKDLLYLKEFSELGVELRLSTEDGSRGHVGRITELLKVDYSQSLPRILWSCGPMGLLKAVQDFASEKKIPCEVSVEETMGCGTGVCLTCVVLDVKGNYLRACIEGPVFDAQGLEWAHV